MRFDRIRRKSAAPHPRLIVPQRVRSLAAALLFLPLVGQGATAHAGTPEPLVTVARPTVVPQALRQAQPLGRMAADANLQVALSLPWRNAAALDVLLGRLKDPADPLYKKYLTHQQFVDRFGPTQADYDGLKSWATANGLSVTGTSPGRNLLIVSGSRDAVEAGFHVQLNRYRLATGRVVFANNAPPRLPQSVAAHVSAVVGLTDLPLKRPFYRVRPDLLGADAQAGPEAQVGSGPGGGLTPADIRSIYSIKALSTQGLDGTGQTIALFEQNGYLATDIATYAKSFGLADPTAGTSPTLSNITLGNYNGAVTDVKIQSEVTLDIEMVLAVAPKAKILVYEYDATQASSVVNDLVLEAKIADDDLASIVSESYGGAEDDASLGGVLISESNIYKQMLAQGQSMFASSGDFAAYNDEGTAAAPNYVVSVSDPASQPLVTAVGGTSLKSAPLVTGVATYGDETTWFTTGLPAPAGGGGGTSKYWAKPDYQTGQGASTTMRDVPDVALNADPGTGYSIFQANTGKLSLGAVTGFSIVGGTSASCPLWAAFFALVNQQRQLYSLPAIGFANPGIYAVAEGANYGADFHDISDASTNGVFKAAVGFDDCTGWGSFIASALLPEFAPTTFGASALTVTVVNANNNPVSGATVVVTTPQVANFQMTKMSAADGTATFTVPIGIHNYAGTGQDEALSFIVTADLAGYAGDSQAGITAPPAAPVKLVIRVPDHTYPSGGLQMISSPYDYSTLGDFSLLFGLTTPLSTTSGSPALFAFSPSLGSYLRYPTAPADTLRLGQGYWALLPANAYVRRKGVPAPSYQPFRINLLAGWNLVGDPFLKSVPISGIRVDTLVPGTPVALGTAPTVQLPFYNYNGAAYQALSTNDSLQPFQGYWIHATQPAELVIPVP